MNKKVGDSVFFYYFDLVLYILLVESLRIPLTKIHFLTLCSRVKWFTHTQCRFRYQFIDMESMQTIQILLYVAYHTFSELLSMKNEKMLTKNIEFINVFGLVFSTKFKTFFFKKKRIKINITNENETFFLCFRSNCCFMAC